MNQKLREKLELTTIGFGFTGLNFYATHVGYPIVGMGFGIVALIFFIRSLGIRQ